MVKEELLGAEYLDIKFKYPTEYKNFLNSMNKLNGTPWWLIGTSKGFFKSCYKFINVECHSKKLLIPFAKSDETNILACFDISHQIWFCGLEDDDITYANWDNRYFMPDFSAWLERVLKGDL